MARAVSAGITNFLQGSVILLKPRYALRIIFYIAALLSALALTQPGSAPLKPGLLVPIYIYPHDWGVEEHKRLVGLKRAYPKVAITAILNVDFDGPDWKTDREYRAKMQRIAQDFEQAGIVTIGYVSSSFSRRPFQGNPAGTGFKSDFKTNVDRWLLYFPRIRGIFIDEMCYQKTLYAGLPDPCLPPGESKAPLVRTAGRSYKDLLPYYRMLYRYIRKTKGLELAIANPGTTPDNAFFDGTVADAIVVYEGPEAYFDPSVYPLDSKPEMTGLLLYNDPAPFALEKLKAVLGKVGLIYLTDDMFTGKELNPWDTLPRYLEQLVAFLASLEP